MMHCGSGPVSVAFLCVMTCFGVSLLLLKYSRPSLPRSPRSGLFIVVSAIGMGVAALGGNIAISPTILAQFFAYFAAILSVLLVLANKVPLARLLLWLIDQTSWIQRWSFTAGLGKHIVRWIKMERRYPVIYFTKTDEISHLVEALHYVKQVSTIRSFNLNRCSHNTDRISRMYHLTPRTSRLQT